MTTQPDTTSMALWHNWRVAHSISPEARQEARQMICLIACASSDPMIRATAGAMIRKLDHDGKLFGSAA